MGHLKAHNQFSVDYLSVRHKLLFKDDISSNFEKFDMNKYYYFIDPNNNRRYFNSREKANEVQVVSVSFISSYFASVFHYPSCCD